MRTVARDFPDVVGAISDGAVRALFSQRFLVATEIYDELVDAACWKILGDIGARPTPGEEKEEETLLARIPRAHPRRPFDTCSRSWPGASIFLEG